jgi:uncharacterized membrane protein
MKKLFVYILMLCYLVIAVGCSSTANTKMVATQSDSARLETATSRTHWNGKTVTAVVFDMQQINPETGENMPNTWARKGHLLESDSIYDRLALGLLSGAVSAAVSGVFLREAFKMKACRSGANCGSVNMNSPLAQSVAETSSQSNVGFGGM